MPARKKQIDEAQVKKWIERGVKKFEGMDCGDKKRTKRIYNSGSGWFWFLGFLGSTFYFFKYVTDVTTAVVAIIKGFIWPAFLVYYLMKFFRI